MSYFVGQNSHAHRTRIHHRSKRLEPKLRIQVCLDAETIAKFQTYMDAYQMPNVQSAALELLKVGLTWTIGSNKEVLT